MRGVFATVHVAVIKMNDWITQKRCDSSSPASIAGTALLNFSVNGTCGERWQINEKLQLRSDSCMAGSPFSRMKCQRSVFDVLQNLFTKWTLKLYLKCTCADVYDFSLLSMLLLFAILRTTKHRGELGKMNGERCSRAWTKKVHEKLCFTQFSDNWDRWMLPLRFFLPRTWETLGITKYFPGESGLESFFNQICSAVAKIMWICFKT